MYTWFSARIALAITVLALSIATSSATVLAHPVDTPPGEPHGICPASFTLHEAGHHNHEGEHAHQHAGTDTDKNDDGWICFKHVGNNSQVHVHIDNNLPQ